MERHGQLRYDRPFVFSAIGGLYFRHTMNAQRAINGGQADNERLYYCLPLRGKFQDELMFYLQCLTALPFGHSFIPHS